MPLDLSPAGFPGCLLYHNVLESMSTASSAAGHAQVTLTLPATPSFAGLQVPTQWFVIGGGGFQSSGLGTLLLK